MDKVRSVDWVTEAGAGGAIDFAESADEEFDMELDNLTVEQVREGNPALFEAIREAAADEAPAEDAEVAEDNEGVAPAAGAASTAEEAKTAVPEKNMKPDEEGEEEQKAPPAAKGTKSGGPAGVPAPDGYVSKADFDALKAQLDGQAAENKAVKTKEALREAADHAADIVAEALSTSLLPLKGREYVAHKFAEATVAVDFGEAGEDLDLDFTYEDDDEMIEAVSAEIELIRALTGGGSNVRHLGAADDDDDDYTPSLRESKESDLLSRIEESDDLPKARDASSVEGYDAKVADIASRI
jgi:hypothetical protein